MSERPIKIALRRYRFRYTCGCELEYTQARTAPTPRKPQGLFISEYDRLEMPCRHESCASFMGNPYKGSLETPSTEQWEVSPWLDDIIELV